MPISHQDVTNSLSHPQSWSAGDLTYSFPGPGSVWTDYGVGDEPSNVDYGPLSAQQQAAFRDGVTLWDRLIAPTIVEVGDGAPGNIRIAFSDLQDHRASSPDTHGYTFTGVGSGKPGDIWFDDVLRMSSFARGSDDGWTLIHELGHALGLRHPFGGSNPLPAEYDNLRYTVMAYQSPADGTLLTGKVSASGVGLEAAYVRPTTPMLFDVIALQARYGADPTTAAGNDTYRWAEALPILETIYDAGGVDTFDLSMHTRASVVDLTPGEFSSIAFWSGQAQAAYWTTVLNAPWAATWLASQFADPEAYTWSRNVAIAPNTIIENVVGGSGGDTIGGNAAVNNIGGRLGNDSIAGGAGEDYLRGDEGNDTLSGGADFDDINGNMGDDRAWGGDGADWVVGGRDQDDLYGEAGADIVYGNLGNDTCDGGEAADIVRGGQGNDVVRGGAGDDWLAGDRGDDTLSGGLGADIFHSHGDAGIDRILDFNRGEGDRVNLLAGTSYTIAQAGADVVVSMVGGGQVVLAAVQLSSLSGDWIFVG